MINPVNESSHHWLYSRLFMLQSITGSTANEIPKRKFVQVIGNSALGVVALSGLSWSALAFIQAGEKNERKD